MSPRRFDPGETETIVLRNGTKAELRAVTAEARPLFERGIEELSPESRYRRFFRDKPTLSESELDYLTQPDGEHHVAIGVVIREADGRERGIGVGRFFRDPKGPDVAEPAIVVLDDFQHQGLGRILLDRLVEAASARGVSWFRTEVLASNRDMLHLIDRIAPDKRVGGSGPVLTVDFPLPGAPHPLPSPSPRLTSPLQRLLEAVADGRIAVEHLASRVRWLLAPDEQ